MKPIWILVANASRARVVSRLHPNGPLSPVVSFDDPMGRAPAHDFATDRSGHENVGSGTGGSTFTPRLDPRTKEHEQFARQLADYLNEAVSSHRCASVAIFASSPFFGLIESHLSPECRRALVRAAPIDLTSFSGPDFTRRVDEQLAVA